MEDFFAVIWAFFFFFHRFEQIHWVWGEKDFICPGRSFSIDFFLRSFMIQHDTQRSRVGNKGDDTSK